jgi:hypothetical protein
MWHKLFVIVSRLWDLRFWIPLTPLGAAVVVTALWAHGRYGTNQLDFVLYAASRVALLTVGAAVVLVVLAAATLAVRLRGSRGTVNLNLEAGVRAATGFTFPRFRRWPMVQVKLRWARPSRVWATLERTGGSLQEVVTPHRRGRVDAVKRRFLLTDIFGLARFGLPRIDAQRVRIVPGRATATGSTLLHFTGGEGLSNPSGPAVGELLDMRRYAHGDPLRHLLWKAFARTRQLLVRTAEHATYPTPSALAYFISDPADEATASMARFFLERGLLGDEFVFQADGSDAPTSDTNEAVEQIITSADHTGSAAAGLKRFLDQGDRARDRHCVLFVPPQIGPWLQRVEAEARAGRLQRATAIVAIDDALGAPRRGRLGRLLFAAAPRELGRSPSLGRVYTALSALGIQLKILHRPSGELVPAARVEALA